MEPQYIPHLFFFAKQQSPFKEWRKIRDFFNCGFLRISWFKKFEKKSWFLHVPFYTLAKALIAGKWLPVRTFSLELYTSEDILAHLCPFLYILAHRKAHQRVCKTGRIKNFFSKNFKSRNSQESAIKKTHIFLWFSKEIVILRRKTRFGAGANSAANLRSCANLAANLRSKPKMEED